MIGNRHKILVINTNWYMYMLNCLIISTKFVSNTDENPTNPLSSPTMVGLGRAMVGGWQGDGTRLMAMGWQVGYRRMRVEWKECNFANFY